MYKISCLSIKYFMKQRSLVSARAMAEPAAAPQACIMRASTRMVMEAAPAHNKEPAMYSDKPPMSTGRLPNRSASGPCSRRNALKLMKNATSERLACASVMTQMVHSVGMAGRYMSVDNGGNAASNIIRMKLFIFFSQKQKGRQKIHRPSQPIASGLLFLKKERFSFKMKLKLFINRRMAEKKRCLMRRSGLACPVK